ncbi:MAG TPA: hypothetical protein VFQ60_00815 [Patescibacteria group bacterium]|nr:hypothetical protein [Patescibacteria group bacterium]
MTGLMTPEQRGQVAAQTALEIAIRRHYDWVPASLLATISFELRAPFRKESDALRFDFLGRGNEIRVEASTSVQFAEGTATVSVCITRVRLPSGAEFRPRLMHHETLEI